MLMRNSNIPSSLRKIVRVVLKLLILVVIVLVVALASGFTFSEIKRNQTLVLPAPTGSYAVGRVAYDWVDNTREEVFAPQKGTKRELFVWIWYPAVVQPASQPAPYLPPQWAQAREQDRGALGTLLTQSYTSIRPHAVENAPLAAQSARYPVLIFEPGMGDVPTDYTTLIEDLVSHGYVVVGITPTYSASVVVFPDGRKIYATSELSAPPSDPVAQEKQNEQFLTIWSQDVIFVMNQLERVNSDPQSPFAGRLDLERMGVFGHSFGGATAAEVCRIDIHCKAGLNLDGSPYGEVIQAGLNKPFLQIYHDGADPQSVHDMRTIAQHTPRGEGYLLTIKGTAHMNFADYALMFSPLRLLGLLGPIDGSRGLEITRAYVRAFFDTYLNHSASPLLQGPSSSYPEVQFEIP